MADQRGLTVQPPHDLSPIEIDAVEERLYHFNQGAIGRDDGRGLGFVIRDETDALSVSPPDIPGQALPNSSRCGSMRHIEDAVTHAL